MMECKACGASSAEFAEGDGDLFQWADAEEWICPECVEEFGDDGEEFDDD